MQSRNTPRFGAWAVALILSAPAFVHAQLVDVDYKSDGDPVASGAAVLGSAGDQWNAISDPTPTALNDVQGNPTSITEAWTGDGTIIAADANTQPVPDLMNDYIFTNHPDAGITVLLGGLTPAQTYELILYTASDDAAGGNRSLIGTVNGLPFAASGDPAPAFVLGTNVAIVSAAADGSGDININIADAPVTNTSGEVDLNGLQIQPLPEPATLSLLGLSGIMLLRRR